MCGGSAGMSSDASKACRVGGSLRLGAGGREMQEALALYEC